ncbi:MAG: hypothetical protein ACR2KQ_10275 [Actinomycetota bacterium]
MQGQERRERAYRAGARMAKERIRREAPEDAAALDQVAASDIVVVRGCYDHVEQVLGALEMPHTVISDHQLAGVALRPEQLLVVNCPGNVGRGAVGQIRDFVAAGGSLFTTDWALKHVVEPAFPGLVSYNEHPTRDDVVRIEITDHDNPFLKGVIDGADDPQWWLEGSSYPIRVDDPERVKVLIKSRDLGQRYGEEPVAILFEHGAGEVFHMISHYYLQRTELRTERHSMAASSYYEEKGMSVPDGANISSLSLGDVEAAQTSSRLFSNVIASKKRKEAQRKGSR